MSLFWYEQITNNYKQSTHTLATSLQTVPLLPEWETNKIPLKKAKKGLPFIPSVYQRASITLEAAIAFPFYLFFLINFISLISFLGFQSRIETTMYHIAKEMGMWGYAYQKAGIEVPEVVLSEGYVKNRILQQLGSTYLDHAPIKGGSRGIHLSGSRIMQDNLIDLRAQYSLTTGMGLIPFPEIPVISRCVVRAWTGYDNLGGMEGSAKEEEYVYISSSSRAYHATPNCTYLDLSVQSIAYEQVKEISNQEGSSYHACQLCNERIEKQVYITDFGECFHSDLSCSGLKRNVQAILRANTGTKTPCTRCIK